jgi:hypothetical protein
MDKLIKLKLVKLTGSENKTNFANNLTVAFFKSGRKLRQVSLIGFQSLSDTEWKKRKKIRTRRGVKSVS